MSRDGAGLGDLRLTMVSPTREKCGVTDYTSYLIEELRKRVDVTGPVDPAQYGRAADSADIVHIQHQYFFFGGVAPWKNRFRSFVRRLSRPAVMTVHEIVTPQGRPHVRAAIRMTNRIQFCHPAIDRLLVHTHQDLLKLTAEGVAPERIQVVSHGVPSPPSLPDRLSARRRLGLDGRFVLTLFGFLSKRKGHGIAVESMRHLPENVILLLAGGQHPNDRSDYCVLLQKMIDASGLGKRVRITGYLSDTQIADIMAATDVVIAPFTEMSGSGSLALAFACGKAIVASDIAPLRELAADAGDAMGLVENSPHRFAAALEQLRLDPSSVKHMEEAAADYAKTHSYGRMADETIGVYQDVLARTHR